jgi:hypothetical protein
VAAPGSRFTEPLKMHLCSKPSSRLERLTIRWLRRSWLKLAARRRSAPALHHSDGVFNTPPKTSARHPKIYDVIPK